MLILTGIILGGTLGLIAPYVLTLGIICWLFKLPLIVFFAISTLSVLFNIPRFMSMFNNALKNFKNGGNEQ